MGTSMFLVGRLNPINKIRFRFDSLKYQILSITQTGIKVDRLQNLKLIII